MSPEAAEAGLLSREELEALLSQTDAAPAGRRGSRSPRGLAVAPMRPGRLAPLLRSLDEFAAEQSRALSTLYQSPIRFCLSDWEELTGRDLALASLEEDRLASVLLEPAGQQAYVVVGRALLFGWMSLAFGCRPERVGGFVPARAFTRIEERYLRRALSELLRQLEKCWQPQSVLKPRLVGLLEPAELQEQTRSTLLVASFHVEGLGELSRLRIALPLDAFDALEIEPQQQPRGHLLHRNLLETRVRLRVEAGSAELSLAEIASLQPGELIPLERSDPQGLLVRIEDAAKFRAERGSVGGRLAVQITDRL